MWKSNFFVLVGGGSWSVKIITDLREVQKLTYGSGFGTLRFLHHGGPHIPYFCKLTFLMKEKLLHICICLFISYHRNCSLLRCFEVETWDATILQKTKRTEILLCYLRWNSWKYNFVEVSEHYLEISQTWDGYLRFCLSTKGRYSWTNSSFLHWWIVLYGFLKPYWCIYNYFSCGKKMYLYK